MATTSALFVKAWPSAFIRTLTAHRLFTVALTLATVLRVDAELGYRWEVYFPDSLSYIDAALRGIPDPNRVYGYSVFLKLLLPLHSYAVVTITQHMMGLLVAVMIYALARHHGAPSWLAVLVTVPVLFDGFEIQLEQLVMSDTLFLFLVMLALTLVTWTPRPAWWAWLLAGLLLGASATVRSVGEPLVVIFAVYLVARLYPRHRRKGGSPGRGHGWIAITVALASLIGAFAVPVLAYEGWYDLKQGQFAMNEATGEFLYSRVMAFAECSRLSLSPSLTPLCPTVPPDQRPLGQEYLWSGDSPLKHLKKPEFSPQVNNLTEQFAIKAITGQPFDYARTVFHDTWRSFAWNRAVFPDAHTYDNYLFGKQNTPIDPTLKPIGTPAYLWLNAPYNYVNGDPVTRVVQPFATIIRKYQEYVWLPGTIYGMILLAGLAGLVLAWRRAGGEGLLPWAVSLALIVTPAATAAFDYRYVLTAVPFGCLAMALTLGKRTANWKGHGSNLHALTVEKESSGTRTS